MAKTIKVMAGVMSCFIVAACAPTIGGDLAIMNVSVIDVAKERVLADQTVVIEGGRISHIGPSQETRLAGDLRVIDGQNKFLAPGIMDMHAHVMREGDALLYLANGVTTVRNMWGEPSLLELTRAIDAGEIPGPRMINAGRIVDGKPPHHFGTVELTDPAAAEAVMSSQMEAGYDFVKIYSNMSLEVFDAVDRFSRSSGVEFSGHVPESVPLRHALDSNMTTMEHFYGVIDAVRDEDGPASPEHPYLDPNAAAVVMKIGKGELEPASLIDQARLAELATKAAASNSWFVPTFEVMKIFTSEGPVRHPEADEYLPVPLSMGWEPVKAILADSPGDLLKGADAIFELQLELAGSLHEGGAKFLVGTDAPNPGIYPGFSVVDEIVNFTKAGFSRGEAIRAATLDPAQYLGMEGRIGEVAENADADLVLLGGNPLADVSAYRSPDFVIARGRVYSREKLDAMLEEMAADNRAMLARFEGAPEIGNPVFFDFVTGDGREMRLARSKPGDPAATERPTVTAALSRQDGWEVLEVKLDPDALVLSRDGTVLTHLPRKDGSPPYVPWTDSPLDMLVIDSLIGTLEEGQTRRIRLVPCTQELECDIERVQPAQLKGLGKDVVDSHYYYAGSYAYELQTEAPGAAAVRYWIGGGPFYGGQPIKLENIDAPRWERFR